MPSRLAVARERRAALPRSLAALGCLTAYGVVAVRFRGPARRRERAVFSLVNAQSNHPWLRMPQQWGTPWTLPGLAVVAVARRRYRVAVAALGCLAVEKGVEAATKKWFGRPRPALVQPTVRHDDAPAEGGSLPSGHAAIATAGTILARDLVPHPYSLLFVPVTALSAWTRVRQGAHEPIDVLAGLLLGAGVALAVTGVVERVDVPGR